MKWPQSKGSTRHPLLRDGLSLHRAIGSQVGGWNVAEEEFTSIRDFDHLANQVFIDDRQSIMTSKLTHERKSDLQHTTILRTPESPINYPDQVSYNHKSQRPKHQVMSKKDLCCSGVHLPCLRDICSGQCPGGNKGGWQKVSPAQKLAKTVKDAIPPTTTPGVRNLSRIFSKHLIL